MAPPDYDICVIGGLGRIGLPLSLLFADAGKRVVSHDICPTKEAVVRSGRMPFFEHGAEEILQRVLGDTLTISLDPTCIARSHFLIVVIGTPVDEHLNPTSTAFLRLFDDILDHLRPDHHVILCSTVFPGTTARVRRHLASKGTPARVSFCPERVVQGNSIEEHRRLPQIVSSFDEASIEEVESLFRLVAPEVVRVEPMVAELAKLFTNSWRYIQFAISNQFYEIAAQHGVDFYDVLDAIRYKYPRARDLPSAGFAAGPCLFKDTMQLAAFSNNSFFLGHAAMLVNEGLPNFLVEHLKHRCSLPECTVGILGMAFKADIDDPRESLSYKLRKILELEAGRVMCSDEQIDDPRFVSRTKLLEEADVVIIGVPHRQYRDLEFRSDQLVIDMWNSLGRGSVFREGAPAAMQESGAP